MRMRMGGIVLLVLVLMIATSSVGNAQSSADTGWSLSGTFNLTHTQSAYSTNWDGDEQGQISWKSQLNVIAEKQLSDLFHNRNTLDLEYGQTQTQDREIEAWTRPTKNADKIEFETVLRFTLHGFVDPYVSGRFLSQFTDKRSGEIEWVNPITLTESAGIAKTLLKNEDKKQEWLARLGLGIQQHIDRKVPFVDGNGNLDYESKTTTYAGIELVSELISQVINENLSVNSKLIIFQAFYNSEKDDLEGLENEDYWQSPDIDWETVFTANITKVIMVNLTTRLLYDKEIDKGGRFKETLAVGVTYTLF
ncbi:DUF3078 domain-containing protein [bacterium]|nr:DUF3078 domain-containing protein [bacterium]